MIKMREERRPLIADALPIQPQPTKEATLHCSSSKVEVPSGRRYTRRNPLAAYLLGPHELRDAAYCRAVDAYRDRKQAGTLREDVALLRPADYWIAQGHITVTGFGVPGDRPTPDAQRVQELAEWLRKRTTPVSINLDNPASIEPHELWYSYALKRRVGELRGEYVGNGEVIAAATSAGLPVVRESMTSPNAYIGIRRDGLFDHNEVKA